MARDLLLFIGFCVLVTYILALTSCSPIPFPIYYGESTI